jgi:hypothetical protein
VGGAEKTESIIFLASLAQTSHLKPAFSISWSTGTLKGPNQRKLVGVLAFSLSQSLQPRSGQLACEKRSAVIVSNFENRREQQWTSLKTPKQDTTCYPTASLNSSHPLRLRSIKLHRVRTNSGLYCVHCNWSGKAASKKGHSNRLSRPLPVGNWPFKRTIERDLNATNVAVNSIASEGKEDENATNVAVEELIPKPQISTRSLTASRRLPGCYQLVTD